MRCSGPLQLCSRAQILCSVALPECSRALPERTRPQTLRNRAPQGRSGARVASGIVRLFPLTTAFLSTARSPTGPSSTWSTHLRRKLCFRRRHARGVQLPERALRRPASRSTTSPISAFPFEKWKRAATSDPNDARGGGNTTALLRCLHRGDPLVHLHLQHLQRHCPIAKHYIVELSEVELLSELLLRLRPE